MKKKKKLTIGQALEGRAAVGDDAAHVGNVVVAESAKAAMRRKETKTTRAGPHSKSYCTTPITVLITDMASVARSCAQQPPCQTDNNNTTPRPPTRAETGALHRLSGCTSCAGAEKLRSTICL